MIVPMKKVSIVIMDKTRHEAMHTLRDLGILHLEKRQVNSDELSRLIERKNKVEFALGFVKAIVLPKGSKAAEETKQTDLVSSVIALSDEKKLLQEKLVLQNKEQSRLAEWGDFDPHGLAELAQAGIKLFPYAIPVRNFKALFKDSDKGDTSEVIVLRRDKTNVYVVAVDKEIPNETLFAVGEQSLSELEASSAAIDTRLAEIERQLRNAAINKGIIEKELLVLQENIEFEVAKSGMDTATDIPAETAIAWFQGYVPHDEVGQIKRAAVENEWALLVQEPTDEDEVPTKLKNNKLASLIYPITDFLEVVPGYREIDISGWFLFFLCIFFGMIFGDAGYGAIVLIAAFIGISKTAKKGVPAGLKLLLLFGIANFAWGVLTCTWFAIDTDLLPNILKQISLPLISNVTAAQSPRDAGIVQQNLMIVCFSLALLHLCIGHILVILRCRTLRILGDLGAITMLVGMYFVVVCLIASNEYRRFELADFMWAVYLFGVGFFFNFVFANYAGSIGRSILGSCTNIISVILGIANCFSDIMSYIRLWAVGLAGGAIASTVNSMAGPMLGHLTLFIIFGVLLAVFGHGLNIVLNVLSVLVHGVRLNTLEFSGHVGLTWSGFAYKPFAKRIKNETQSG
ncbi:V-type ATP synthase subunit I [Spirochaetia bacterium]|nr:V-type ATP synthase subunit I [Spirochaetia bacterium]